MEVFRKVAPKEKRPAGRQPRWTSEFMMMVASKVVDEGMKYREAAKIFDISQGSVNAWVKKYRKGTLASGDKEKPVNNDLKVYRLEDQINDLKAEIGNLYLENQMLKKVLYQSQSRKKDVSSVITSSNLDQFQKDVK